MDEFQPYLPVPTAPAELKATQAQAESTADDRFTVPGIFLEALWSDAAFREQWDEVIQKRVEEKFAAEQEELRAKTIADARAEGIAQGLEESRALVAEIDERLKHVCERVLEEKEALLHAHEKMWCDAMLHLLRRFLVRRPEEVVSVLQAWMDDSLRGFPQKARIRIYLSESDNQQVQRAMSFRLDKGGNHEFTVDRNLSAGEIRCECDGGGIFFSPSQELTDLEAYLGGIFQTSESGEAA